MRYLVWIFLFIAISSGAEPIKLKHFEKIAVFPIAHDPTNDDTQKALDDAWWKFRDVLTSDKRFSVATKQMLISRDAFQPRKDNLSVQDVIFLGKAIDAQVLIALKSYGQVLSVRAYNYETGTSLWSKDYKMNLAELEKDQIARSAEFAARDFLNAVPFKGYQIGDIVRSNQIRATAFRGKLDVMPGDVAEWIEISEKKSGEDLFNNYEQKVLAQGTVEAVDNDHVQIRVTSLDNLKGLKDHSLIQYPKLAIKVSENQPEIDLRNLDKNKAETRSASNVFLAAIFHAVALILLAF